MQYDARRKPKVLFINRSYWPDAEATGQLLTELCEDLADTFDVTVIAGLPNANPTGDRFRRCGSEVRNGVRIRRVWHTSLPKSRLIARALNYLTFLLGAMWTALCSSRYDVVVVETDPPLLCLVGAIVKRLRGCRLVVYLQDIHPDIGVALAKLRNGWMMRNLRSAMVHVYRRADQVIVLSRDMRDHVVSMGVPKGRIAVLSNWVDTNEVAPVKVGNTFRSTCQSGRFVVMYSGNLGLSQRLEDVLTAARHLCDRPDIQFVFIGGGAKRAWLEALTAEWGLTNVRFFPYQPKSSLGVTLSAADIHLVPLDPALRSLLMPSKVYAALASGTPVLAIAPAECELSELVTRNGVGCVTPPGVPEALAAMIRRLADGEYDLNAMGNRARSLASTQFDRRLCTERFGAVLNMILGRSSPAPRPVSLEATNLCTTKSRK